MGAHDRCEDRTVEQTRTRTKRDRGFPAHPRVRELRRNRFLACVLRPGRERGAGGGSHGCGLGRRDHDLRHRRRVRRRAQRDVHRQLDSLARRAARADDEDVQPDERGRRQRALSGADPQAGRDEPRAARRRAHRPVPLARDGPGDARSRRPRRPSTSSGARARSAPGEAATSTPPGSRRLARRGCRTPYSLLDRADEGQRHPPLQSARESATARSARWRAAGSPASTAAARSRPRARG